MTEPELLTSGSDRHVPPAARRAALVSLAAALLAAVVALAAHGSRHSHHEARTAPSAPSPVALPSTASAGPAAPITADLSRVALDPARHRLRLVLTVFNTQASRVVLVRVMPHSPGLTIRGRSFARFVAAGSWHPARLPIVLAPAQSAHLTLDYGVRRCPPANAVRLSIPAVLSARERGRISVDLGALISPRDWPHGLIAVLCPISSR